MRRLFFQPRYSVFSIMKGSQGRVGNPRADKRNRLEWMIVDAQLQFADDDGTIDERHQYVLGAERHGGGGEGVAATETEFVAGYITGLDVQDANDAGAI